MSHAEFGNVALHRRNTCRSGENVDFFADCKVALVAEMLAAEAAAPVGVDLSRKSLQVARQCSDH